MLPQIDKTPYSNNFIYGENETRRILVDTEAIKVSYPKSYDKVVEKFAAKREELEREKVLATRRIEDAEYKIEKLPSTVTEKNKSEVFSEINSLKKQIEEDRFYISSLKKQIEIINNEEAVENESALEKVKDSTILEIAKVINQNIAYIEDFEHLAGNMFTLLNKIETNNRKIQLTIKDRSLGLYDKQNEIYTNTTFPVNDLINKLNEFVNTSNGKINKLTKIVRS